MAAYRLTSDITPLGPRSHRVLVSAVATDDTSEEVRLDIAPTIGEAEARRAVLLALFAVRLRSGGHEVVTPADD